MQKTKTASALICIFFFFTCAWTAQPLSLEQIFINTYQHHVAELTPSKPSIKLEDGSRWACGAHTKLSEENKIMLTSWKPGDCIEFSVKTGLFKTWYFLINTATGDEISTKLLKPALDNVALYIADFDLASKIVTLSDGSKWSITKKTCLHCLSSIKKRFHDKVFVAREHKQAIFYLISYTSLSTDHLEVVPAE